MATDTDNGSNAELDAVAQKFLKKREDLPVDKIFRALVKVEGSDLHMKVGRPPMVRVKGELRPLNMPARRRGRNGSAVISDDG